MAWSEHKTHIRQALNGPFSLVIANDSQYKPLKTRG